AGALLLTRSAFAEDKVVKHFASGNSNEAVGIADASEDVEIGGPQALTADRDGRLFVLDQLNQRIIQFDPKRPTDDANIYDMPPSVQPNDLVVRGNEFLVWDSGIRSLKPSADTTSTRGIGNGPIKLEEDSSRGVDDVLATSAFAQMGSQPVSDAAEL